MAGPREMLDAHPATSPLDATALAQAIQALVECAITCTQCADACLSEEGPPSQLARCIRLDLDCADVCATMSRVLGRVGGHEAEVLRPLLEACAATCRICAAECQRHADHMPHCAICAESCRRCEEACRELVAAIA